MCEPISDDVTKGLRRSIAPSEPRLHSQTWDHNSSADLSPTSPAFHMGVPHHPETEQSSTKSDSEGSFYEDSEFDDTEDEILVEKDESRKSKKVNVERFRIVAKYD